MFLLIICVLYCIKLFMRQVLYPFLYLAFEIKIEFKNFLLIFFYLFHFLFRILFCFVHLFISFFQCKFCQGCIWNPVKNLWWSIFAKMVNEWKPLNNFEKNSTLYVLLGIEFASALLATFPLFSLNHGS